MSAPDFFYYARERYQVMLLKDEGRPSPWTTDHILQQFRFCNVFREDDKTTQWIRKHISYKGYVQKTLQAIVIARWFNRIATLELLLPRAAASSMYLDNLFYTWDSDEARSRLGDVHPLVTGAYIVKTPAKMSKLEGIIWCLEQTLPHLAELQDKILGDASFTLREATAEIATFPYLGPFMSYEIVTDLRHTQLLRDAPDIMTWANPGPGAARGAGRVVGEGSSFYNRYNTSDYDKIQGVMRSLLHMSMDPLMWPANWPSWEMREVEHTLCEWDKYERARLGEGRPKQRYQGGAL